MKKKKLTSFNLKTRKPGGRHKSIFLSWIPGFLILFLLCSPAFQALGNDKVVIIGPVKANKNGTQSVSVRIVDSNGADVSLGGSSGLTDTQLRASAVDVNNKQVNGTTIDTNSGNKSAGTQRVVIATDQPATTTPLDVNIKQVGGGATDTTNNVQAVVTKKIAAATYAPTVFTNLGANATLNVKASTGNIYSLSCANANAAPRWIQLHNTATTPSGGAAPAYSFLVPAGGQIIIGTDFFTQEGANFAAGIAFAFSTTRDTYTAGTAADQATVIHYK